ncbi:MAG: hypothetical protein AB8F95_21070 [Bacteroidia bacterium]
MSSWTKNWLISFFNKLPLWGKIALPVGIIILITALLKTLKTIIVVAAIGLIVFGLLSVYDTWKKESTKKKSK